MDLDRLHLDATMAKRLSLASFCDIFSDRLGAVIRRWGYVGHSGSRARLTLDDLKSLRRRELVDLGLDPIDDACASRDLWLDFRNRI